MAINGGQEFLLRKQKVKDDDVTSQASFERL